MSGVRVAGIYGPGGSDSREEPTQQTYTLTKVAHIYTMHTGALRTAGVRGP